VHVFFVKEMDKKTKRKESSRTIGIGGTRKNYTYPPPLLLVEEINRPTFLHVPIPTALRLCLSSPSHNPTFLLSVPIQSCKP
jgi:hypothetical protein